MTASLPFRQSLDPLASSLGLVFTDARGRVIFGDTHFLDLVGPDKAGVMVGQPLHQIMGANRETISELIADVGRTGYVRDHRLSMMDRRGEPLLVACSGIATYDEQGGFIGVDLTLRDPDHTALPSMLLDSHGDILNARIQQIEYEAQEHGAEKSVALANLYFTAQASAIAALLGRMGGPRAVEAFESLVNKAASKKAWPIQVKGGRFVVQLGKIPLEAFRLLLAEIFNFAASIIGQRGLTDEMRLVDERVKSEAKAVAAQAGLRDFLG